ncbi:MAG: hypothetical protein HZB41_12655, partial [Ignavibacteriae bacterium]|nr:hypothetical protein [Ignavibacteriota bacterium]
LKTFQIFSIGAESPQTRDAVLLKATDAVFSHQNTGFNSGEHDSSSNNPTILEIIKSFAHDSKT